MSSAYIWKYIFAYLDIMYGIRYKQIDKSEGPGTDPWGIPYFIGKGKKKNYIFF